ncbi:MAG: M23 family metallopeptidase [Pseudomonadota bacterium]
MAAAQLTGKSRQSVEAQQLLGLEPPILAGSGRRPPDKRQVSFRWLSGTFLTGVTSTLLMGGALYAALDGRQLLATPPQASSVNGDQANKRKRAEKGDRPLAIIATQSSSNQVMQIPTVTRVGEAEVIKKRPFGYIHAPLAVATSGKLKYPAFNALTVFSTSGKEEVITAAASDQIYGADIESEVTVRVIDYPLDSELFDPKSEPSAREVEKLVVSMADELNKGTVMVAAMPWFDDSRFSLQQSAEPIVTGPDIRITAANVLTISKPDSDAKFKRSFSEEVIAIRKTRPLAEALGDLGAEPASIRVITDALTGELGSTDIEAGYKLRVAFEQTQGNKSKSIRRVSIYYQGRHISSIARRDNGTFVYGPAPAPIPAVAADNAKPELQLVASAKLPNTYNGIYRAAMSQKLSPKHIERLVKVFAFDVDFQKRITPADELEVFYSLEDGGEDASSAAEILYAGITLNGTKKRYYRFRTSDDGVVDFYDEFGKSAKKFLLRKPVPNARFRSGFGMRRHPISGYRKMHTGVDWSAKRGTPILSAGNGVVEKAGWHAGGYGKQTIIRHANGYKTSYSHQSRIAKGVKPGARVRQGQVIGSIGTTGLSTGPHLHYEVIVNGNKVNPMRIRLPKGRVLKGAELAAFERERDRINALINPPEDQKSGGRLAFNQ